MIKKMHAATAILLLALCACSEQDQTRALDSDMRARQGLAAQSASPVSGLRSLDAIASSPDRGALVNYDRRMAALKQGAFTSHRVEVSEDHAMRAIVTGNLTIPAPDGEYLQLKYERHAESINGNWTWVGRLAGGDQSQEAIITFGEKAVFGSIPQGGGRPDLALTTRAGKLWVVETDPRLAPRIDRREQDTLVPMAGAGGQPAATASSGNQVTSASAASATSGNSNTIDVLLGYTTGFAAKFGGQSQAVTRLTHLVDINNQAFANSQVNGTMRLVGTQQVDYTDGGTNRSALIDLTGSDGSRTTAVPASLQPLRAARETLGADLVALVRKYEYGNEGCGIAWLLGAGQQAIVPSEDASFGYSVVSNLPDGTSVPGSEDKNYFCSKESLAHELAHLMGSAHDIENTKNDAGVVRYGRYPYSFGAKTDPTAGNYYTIMSYGDDGQTPYRVFSNPRVTTCGGFACGEVSNADNARSLNQTMPIVVSFRSDVTPLRRAENDFDGDGKSDVLWRNAASGQNIVWRSGSIWSASYTQTADLSWQALGSGDFDGDGRADFFWRHSLSGRNIVWPSGSAIGSRILQTVPDTRWRVVGIGDFDGDSRADLFWHHASTGQTLKWLAAEANNTIIGPTVDLDWQVSGVGDFDGDGRADIFWRSSISGESIIWLSGSSSRVVVEQRVPNLAWKIAAVGDFDGDGKSDIFWKNESTGETVVWPAGSFSRATFGAIVAPGWRVATSGNYNGDASSDIFWFNASTGESTVWWSALPGGSMITGPVAMEWSPAP